MKTSHRQANVAIEFLVTLLLLISIGMSVGRVGAFLAEKQRFVQATFEAARYAAMGPDLPSQGEVRAYADEVMSAQGLDASQLSLSISHGLDGEDEIVTVVAELPVQVGLGGALLPTTHLQGFTLVITGGT